MKIGIFDSGFGGLSTLFEAQKIIPNADFIYYADEAHVPYGEKSEEQIREFASQIIDFFIAQNVDAILIACNTASSVISHEYRAHFDVPIIAMEPAVKKAVDSDKFARILVAATEVTIKGAKLKKLLADLNQANIDLIALGGLVRLAESGEFDKAREYIKSTIGEKLVNYDILVLGCTHFNYFKSEFKALAPKIKFVDGNEGAINQLLRKLKSRIDVNSQGSCEFYISGIKATNKELEFIEKCLFRLKNQYEI